MTSACNPRKLEELINTRFGGKLLAGSHENEDDKCSILEAISICRGIYKTDQPSKVRSFDIRSLNDIDVADELRTEWMLKVGTSYDGSLDWPLERQKAVVERVVILTVNRIIAELPGLHDEIRDQCRNAHDLRSAARAAALAEAAARAAEAEAAAWGAAWAEAAEAAEAEAEARAAARAASWAAEATAWGAAWAEAEAAARAASWAAEATARGAARAQIFVAACQLWLEAAEVHE